LIHFPGFSSVQKWFVEHNQTEYITVRNGSVLGNNEASSVICNSNFGSSGADTLNFFSDAHAFTYLTLYKQSKEEAHFLSPNPT
jgi:hypothetical protein